MMAEGHCTDLGFTMSVRFRSPDGAPVVLTAEAETEAQTRAELNARLEAYFRALQQDGVEVTA